MSNCDLVITESRPLPHSVTVEESDSVLHGIMTETDTRDEELRYGHQVNL